MRLERAYVMESVAEYTTTVSTPFEEPFVESGDGLVCEREMEILQRGDRRIDVKRRMWNGTLFMA
jgi:hypothetical protein